MNSNSIDITVIVLIIIGIIFIILSFVLKDKNRELDNKVLDKSEHKPDNNVNESDIHIKKDEILEEINDKILELNDYSSFIKKELNDKHKELLFLYQLICEKEKNIKKISDFNNIDNNKIIEHINSHDELFEENYSLDSSNVENKNQQIIDLHKKGCSITEIAKIMALGKGEVKLILELGITKE